MTYERLRQARELKGWGIEELSRRTGLRPHLLEAIERGDFGELPAGVYCRSSIRSYATAVGLNPDEVLESVRPLLPVLEDPLDALARRHGHARKPEPRQPEAPVASVSAAAKLVIPAPAPAPRAPVRDAGPEPLAAAPVHESAADRMRADGVVPPTFDGPLGVASPDWRPRIHGAAAHADHAADVVLALTPASPALSSAACASTADAPRLAYGGIRHWWRPLSASVVDGLVLAAMGCALVWLTALACGTSVAVALQIAGPAMALVFALIVALYFVIFGGVGNATPGVMAMRLETPPSGRTVLNAREVFGRARRSLFHDDSLLVD